MSNLQYDANQLGFNADVIVVGAGISGLHATRRLIKEGANVLLLEARERVGGRMATSTFNGEIYDVGAHWIPTHATQLRALLAELNIPLHQQYHAGASAFVIHQRTHTFRQSAPWLAPWVALDVHRIYRKLNKLVTTLQVTNHRFQTNLQRIDRLSFGAWLHQQCRYKATITIFETLCKIYFYAMPDEISLFYIVDQVNSHQGAQTLFNLRPTFNQERIPGGTQRIAEQLAKQMQEQVLTDTPVLALRQDNDSVIAYSRGNSFRARYAILAIPPAVAEQIYFEPTLPAVRDILHQRVLMGRAISATLCFDYPFWRENGKSGVFISNDGPATLVHDVSPTSGTEGALACLISGDNATHWGAQPKSERLQALVTQLQPWFGDEINAYRGLIERDWNTERWSRGATGFMPNGSAQYIQSLALPIGRLHFAGGETATHWTNTLEGAIEAGERAAAEVVAELTSGGYLRKMIVNDEVSPR